MTTALIILVAAVFILPLTVRLVEENLEAFLFIMGIAACLIAGHMNVHLILEAILEPWQITLAVLAAGMIFYWLRDHFSRLMQKIYTKVPLPLVVLLTVSCLGLLSSVITAIIASLVLIEMIILMPIDRKSKIVICILSCFSIGLGAVLTPLGEPLATITTSKLNADFFFLFHLLGQYVIFGVILFACIAAVFTFIRLQTAQRKELPESEDESEDVKEDMELEQDTPKSVVLRAAKVYLFVMALVFLGEGLIPLVEKYILGLSPNLLYWINISSAVLDNATLAAAEISPAMDSDTLRAILMGLLLSGGMLIPGNIPNIISAARLRIRASEWAVIGIPVGLVAMFLFYFMELV